MRWLAFLLLLGCGDNLGSIALEDRQLEEAAAKCKRNVRCGLIEDEETCLTSFRRIDERSVFAAVAAGTVRYNAIAEERCLRDLETASCDRTVETARTVSLACNSALVGTTPAGASCALDEECVTGRCALDACPRTTCCNGTCKPALQPTGGSCTITSDCDAGYCADGICHALELAGGPCSNDRACAFGLGCVGTTPQQAGACRKLPALGEACPYDRCADLGARCVAGTCVRVGLSGDSCASASDCSPLLECRQGVCSHLPTVNEPCTLTCAGDAFCQDGSCSAPLGSGAACLADDECSSRLCEEGPIFDACAPAPVCY